MSPYREPSLREIADMIPTRPPRPHAWNWQAAVATAAMVVAAGCALGQLAACGFLQEAIYGPAVPVLNPADDAELYHCRMLAEVDHDMNHDAVGACRMYDRCVIDAGLRGDIGFCATDGGAHD